MAYFARDNNQPSPRKVGLATQLRNQDPRVSPGPTREERRAADIDKMAATVPKGETFISQKLSSEASPHRGAPPRGQASTVFDGPKPPTPVAPRIRPGVSDDDLRRIWAEDERKAQAATKMAQGSSMAEKMAGEQHPMLGAKDAGPRGTKRVEQTGFGVSDKYEPQGFKGVGQTTRPEPTHGLAKAKTEFKPAEFHEVKSPRTTGLKQVGPKDQFSIDLDPVRAQQEAAKSPRAQSPRAMVRPHDTFSSNPVENAGLGRLDSPRNKGSPVHRPRDTFDVAHKSSAGGQSPAPEGGRSPRYRARPHDNINGLGHEPRPGLAEMKTLPEVHGLQSMSGVLQPTLSPRESSSLAGTDTMTSTARNAARGGISQLPQ